MSGDIRDGFVIVVVGLVCLVALLVWVVTVAYENTKDADLLASCKTFESKELRDQCRLDVVKSRIGKQNKGE